jgi:hypothetical protein
LAAGGFAGEIEPVEGAFSIEWRSVGNGPAGRESMQSSAELLRKASEYRKFAARTRDEAEESSSSQEREAILRTALRWEMLAEEVERTNVQLGRYRPDWLSYFQSKGD